MFGEVCLDVISHHLSHYTSFYSRFHTDRVKMLDFHVSPVRTENAALSKFPLPGSILAGLDIKRIGRWQVLSMSCK